MSLLTSLRSAASAVFQRKRVENDTDEELRAHVQNRADDLERKGFTRAEAERRARIEFGAHEKFKEECREATGAHFLQTLFQDLHFGVRMLRKSPGFTAVAILTLALGIGANTAIFSLINAVMLRTLPIRDPQSLLLLRWNAVRYPDTIASYSWGGCPNVSNDPDYRTPAGCSFSYPMFEQIRSKQDIFSGVSAFAGSNEIHVSMGGQVTMAQVQLVSGAFFSTLGASASAGRLLEPADDLPGAPHAVTLSYAFWQNRLGGDPSVAGKSIVLENTPFIVTGVAAPKFSGLDPGLSMDMWAAISSQDVLAPHFPKRTAQKSLWVQIIARRKPEVSVTKAESTTDALFVPGVTSGPGAVFKAADAPRVQLLNAARGLVTLRREFSEPLFLLMAAVGIVLLIACANVAGLSISRAMARQQEMAVRFALGATRTRIARQLLTESFLLAGLAAVLGIILAYWSSSALAAFLSANWYRPLAIDIHPDTDVLGFTIAVAVLTALLFGLAPSLHCVRFALFPAMKGSANVFRSVRGLARQSFSLGSGLVVVQVGLSIIVLSGAGLLVRTLVNLKTQNYGFDAHNVLLFYADPRLTGYKGDRLSLLYREMQDRLSALPGVTSASYSMFPLLSGASMDTQYAPKNAPDAKFSSDVLPVGPHFFETMRIPVLAGRAFVASDFETQAKPQLVVVNESLARRLFGQENPLGGELIEHGSEGSYVVVGVVGDAKYTGLRSGIRPTAYVPHTGGFGAEFELRTAGDPEALLTSIRRVAKQVNGDILISSVKTQIGQINQTLYQERLFAGLSSLFGALALLLACIGIYGLLSYEVTRRTREIGIRMALGAQKHEIRKMVAGRGLLLALAGAIIGVAGAAGLTRYLETLLYGVKPIDPWVFIGAIILLCLVALLACFNPTRRATRVDPMVALRYE
jgi:predicted permease